MPLTIIERMISTEIIVMIDETGMGVCVRPLFISADVLCDFITWHFVYGFSVAKVMSSSLK